MSEHKRENEMYFECSDALDDWGYVLALDTTNCVVKKADADDMPIGVAFTSTVNYVTDVAEADKVVAIRREGENYVKLLATNLAIDCGDYVATAAGGYVDLGVINTAGTIAQYHASISYLVGIALEAKAANAGGKIKVLLTMRNL